METRHAVSTPVAVVCGLMALRGVVALAAGDLGTVARQVGVGAVLAVFGVAVARNWDTLGA